MSSLARVERATCRLGGDRSIHLSYKDKEDERRFGLSLNRTITYNIAKHFNFKVIKMAY